MHVEKDKFTMVAEIVIGRPKFDIGSAICKEGGSGANAPPYRSACVIINSGS